MTQPHEHVIVKIDIDDWPDLFRRKDNPHEITISTEATRLTNLIDWGTDLDADTDQARDAYWQSMRSKLRHEGYTAPH